jgi:hypothetical protein
MGKQVRIQIINSMIHRRQVNLQVGRGPSKSAPCHISMSSRTNLLFFVVKVIIESFLEIIQQKITDLF